MKRILITGATSGIGKALCLLYQKQGYAVIACGRNQQALDEMGRLKLYEQLPLLGSLIRVVKKRVAS
ncbi:MAG: NADP-dependent 3-hydroxy acid dehydrogenase YdfG [Psychromonas sp.]|jgi:NADP-dependent 3-hydroxy acid dehydrogenase YdfG